jgi:DNA-binding HxlR family transcriptional regulator
VTRNASTTARSRGRASAPPTDRPTAELLDLLGRRWVLRILWELRAAPLSSRGLAARCGGVSPTVLHKRLRELRAATFIVLEQPGGYALSPDGVLLTIALLPVAGLARRWAEAKGGADRSG